MATPDAVFVQGLDVFGAVVAEAGTSDWERPTPCAAWCALDVLGHVGSAVHFGATLLTQGQAAWKPLDPPGAAVQGDPVEWWDSIAPAARQAVSGTDLSRVVDAPRGPRSVAEGLSVPALDLFIHAWDLGRSFGVAVEVPAEVIEFGRAVIETLPPAQVRSPAVFADEAVAPEGATPTEQFMAFTGRDPRWAP